MGSCAGQGMEVLHCKVHALHPHNLTELSFCQVHSVPALEDKVFLSLVAAKIGAGISRSKQLVFSVNREPTQASPPSFVRSYIRYILDSYTFSFQHNPNVTRK